MIEGIRTNNSLVIKYMIRLLLSLIFSIISCLIACSNVRLINQTVNGSRHGYWVLQVE